MVAEGETRGFGYSTKVPGLTAPAAPTTRTSGAFAGWTGTPVTVSNPVVYSNPVRPRPVSYAPPGYVAQNTYGGAPQGSGGGSGGSFAAAASAPAKPKIDYNSAEYLNGQKDSELDGTFQTQKQLYSDKLKRYIADYDAQSGGKAWGKDAEALKGFNLDTDLGGSMGVDYRNSSDGIKRNRELGLTNMAEDFAQRGMMNSGLWSRDWQQGSDNYTRQKDNLGQGVRNQLQTLNFNRGNMESDNTAQIAAARRDALNRLSQAQSLV